MRLKVCIPVGRRLLPMALVVMVERSRSVRRPEYVTGARNQCGGAVLTAASATCLVQLVLRSVATGDQTASMAVQSSDPSFPDFTVELHGVGVDQVGGAATAVDGVQVACQNLTPGKRRTVRFSPDAASWDCEDQGLKVDAGDSVRFVATGTAR